MVNLKTQAFSSLSDPAYEDLVEIVGGSTSVISLDTALSSLANRHVQVARAFQEAQSGAPAHLYLTSYCV